MNPVDRNYDKGCTKTSAKCVIWQGPDIPCLNLCNGDSIQDVVYKLGQLHCELATSLDLSSLDLSCLVEACQSCPDPIKTLKHVLELIIAKICSLEEIVQGLDGGTPGSLILPTLNLPGCLQYDEGATAVVSLQMDDYLLHLADEFCLLSDTVNTLGTRMTTAEDDIAALQAAGTPPPVLPSVNLICSGSGLTVLDDAVEAIETTLCALRTATGIPASITSAISKQCTGLAASTKLYGTGVMSSITGWVNAPATSADAITNLWLTVCDMRSQVQELKTNAAANACNSFVPNFSFEYNTARTQATLKTYGYMSIPSGFTNGVGNQFVISDGTNTYNLTIDLVALTASSTGIVANLTSNGIDTTKTLTVTLQTNIVNGGTTCSKVATKIITLPCIKNPVTGLTASATATTISASWVAPTGVGVPVGYYSVNTYKDVSGTWVLKSANAVTTNSASINVTGMGAALYKVEVIAEYPTCGSSILVFTTVNVP